MFAFLLLTFGVLGVYAAHRVLCWMERRGWIYYRRRGTSAALGNALLQVQTFYQPSVEQVLEARLEEPAEAAESGDPPSDETSGDPRMRNARARDAAGHGRPM